MSDDEHYAQGVRGGFHGAQRLALGLLSFNAVSGMLEQLRDQGFRAPLGPVTPGSYPLLLISHLAAPPPIWDLPLKLLNFPCIKGCVCVICKTMSTCSFH